MKISTSWGRGKLARRRTRNVLNTKIRWNLLGLQDPALVESTPSIEDIRREIISLASGDWERAQVRIPTRRIRSAKSDADATTLNRKRRRGATE